jgi:shikimate kinase
MPHVTLVGSRGTGKSAVAAALGRLLGLPWIDADTVLEERVGCSIAAVIAGRGEGEFRDIEVDVLRDLLATSHGVLATGGGVVLRPENRALLRARGRPVVWLTASADVIRGRLAADPATATRRPSLTGGDPLAEVADVLQAREPLYREVADVAFDTGGDLPPVVAERIRTWLAARSPETGA